MAGTSTRVRPPPRPRAKGLGGVRKGGAEGGPLDEQGTAANPLTGMPWTAERAEWAAVWSTFPIYAKATRNRVLETVDRCSVTVVKSATGSGKTVLTPAMLLYARALPALAADTALAAGEGQPSENDGGRRVGRHRVAVTTPKRVTTFAAAETAARTLDVPFGQRGEAHVSVEYRGSNPNLRTTAVSRITYFTDGTLLARTRSDPTLLDYDVIIVDEAHERPVPTDMLLLGLRGALKARPEMRLVIMSATIDTEPFRAFYEAEGLSFGVVEVAGTSPYPIERRYLAQAIPEGGHLAAAVDLALEVVSAPLAPVPPGAKRHDDILVFVPTTRDASKGCEMFNEKCAGKKKGAGNENGNGKATKKLCHAAMCASLYSKLSGKGKAQATGAVERGYTRKVVFATNIAESSITLEGLGFVIDTGLELGSDWDPVAHGTVLTRRKATRSQVQQRCGRVGRTAPGVAYLLYTQADHDARAEYPSPSITTIDFTDHLLQRLAAPGAGALANARAHFASMLTPPTAAQMASAERYLVVNGLLSGVAAPAKEALTPMGEAVTRVADAFRVTTASALLIYAGAVFGCVDEAVRLAAVLESDVTTLWHGRGPPAGPALKPDVAQAVDPRSDHVTLSNLVEVARARAGGAASTENGEAAVAEGGNENGRHRNRGMGWMFSLREAGLNSESWRAILRAHDQWVGRGAQVVAEAPPPAHVPFAFASELEIGKGETHAPLLRAIAMARYYHVAKQGLGGSAKTLVSAVAAPTASAAPEPAFAQGSGLSPADVALYESLVKGSDGTWKMHTLTWVKASPSTQIVSAKKVVSAKKISGGRRLQ